MPLPAVALLTITALVAGLFPRPGIAGEPFRFLGIPIIGTIGADRTADGVEAAIALARDQGLDGILLEFDARTGDLDDGVAIAGLITEASSDLRTIAVVRRAGGPALPILFACETWIVLDSTTIEGRDERGESTATTLDADRVAVQSLPARGDDLDSVEATLAATRAACRRHLPATLDENTRRHRSVLAEVLTTAGLDLLVADTSELPDATGAVAGVTAVPARRPLPPMGDAVIVPTADLGPGITATQFAMTGLARLTPNGLEPLAAALGVPVVESFGDVGAALVTSAADDRAADRASLGSRIDSMFSALDGAGQLIRAMPWTVARARLSDPSDPRRAGRLPMVHADGAWRLAPESLPYWTRFCDDSIRRWRGVEELVGSIDELVDRAAMLRGELAAIGPDAADVDRLSEALRLSATALETVREDRRGFDDLATEAASMVAVIERWRETPPALPTPSPADGR